MKRYFKILRQLWYINLKRIFIYPVAFFSSIGVTLYWVILPVVSISVLTYQASNVGGWSRGELFIVQGVYSIVFGFLFFLVDQNLVVLVEDVWKGNFDFKLLKPVDSQFMASIGYMKFNAIFRILAGVLLVVFAVHAYHMPMNIGLILSFFVLCICSMSVAYSLWLLISMVSFWTPNTFNLSAAMVSVTALSRYPLIMFRSLGEPLFYLLLPLIVITTVPAQILTGKVDLSLVALSLLFSVGGIYLVRKLWFFSLRFYTSASS